MFRKIAFTMYVAKDIPRARRFYEEELGLKPGLAGNNGDSWWVEYDLPEGGCLALTNAADGAPGAGAAVALEVEDLDRLIDGLKAKGVAFRSGVVHGPRCRMAVCADPEGNAVILHQLNSKP